MEAKEASQGCRLLPAAQSLIRRLRQVRRLVRIASPPLLVPASLSLNVSSPLFPSVCSPVSALTPLRLWPFFSKSPLFLWGAVSLFSEIVTLLLRLCPLF